MTPEGQEYADRCLREMYAYTETSTRFGAGSLRVESASAALRQLHVVAHHELEVRWEWKEHHGTLSGNPGDFVTGDEAAHKGAMQAQVEEEVRRRVSTAEEIAARLGEGLYPGLSARVCFRTHPRALLYRHRCDPCSGQGRITCSACSGRGQSTCWGCNGTGRTNCTSCGGRGSRTEYRTEWANGQSRSVTRDVPCFSCSYGKVTCSSCMGTGRTTCGACHGSGNVQCGDCGGHGALTRVAHVRTYVTPEFSLVNQGEPGYVATTLARLGLPKLPSVGQVTTRRISPDPGGAEVRGDYDAAVWFCELVLSVGARSTSCLAFGMPPALAEAGGYLGDLLESDIEPLKRAWLPWSRSRAIKNFMASQVHRQIVASEANGHAPDAIANFLRNVVSAEYVGRALAALAVAVRAKLLWRELGWIALLTLLSVALTPVMLALHTPRSPFLSVPGRQASSLWGYSIPVAAVFGYLAAKLNDFWISRVGGKDLRSWIVRKRLLSNLRAALLGSTAGALSIVAFYSSNPLWIDADGYAYSLVPVTTPYVARAGAFPVQAPPTPPVVPTSPARPRPEPARPTKKKGVAQVASARATPNPSASSKPRSATTATAK